MREKNTYTGSKVQNQFTAYLLSFIRGKRRNYLVKQTKIRNSEEPMKSWKQADESVTIEDYIEKERKEALLLQEAQKLYPAWDEMSDKRLLAALMTLRDDERKLIYQHVFEERGFEEMSRINQLPSDKVKGVYYYAIRKIRKIMGGELF